MKTNKLLSMIVAVFMLLTIVAVPSYADAAYSMALGLGDGAAVVEGGATLVVSIYGNSNGANVQGVGFKLTYDPALFTFKADSVTGVAQAGAAVYEIDESNLGTLRGSSMFDGKAYALDQAWATVAFEVATVAEITEASFALSFDPDSTWADANLNPIAEADVDFGAPATIKVAPARTANPTATVTIDNMAPVSGDTLTASYVISGDAWGLTESADAVITWSDGSTGSTYVVDADDFGTAITATVAGTVAAPTFNAFEGSATTAEVTVPATAPTLDVVETRDDVVAVNVELNTNATAVADVLVGGDTTIAYSWKVNGVEVATTETYVPTMVDYGTGTSTITCDVTATSARNSATATKTVTFTKAIVAGNMQPEIANLAILKNGEALAEAVAPIVNDVLTVTYDFEDIAASDYEGPADTDASVITWTIGEKVVVADSYTVVGEDIGKAIAVKVDAVSSDATPNENLDLTAETVVIGNSLEAATVAAEKNTALKPVVSDIVFDKTTIRVGTKVTVSYTYSDANAIEDASEIAFVKAEEEDAADWDAAVEGVDYTVEDGVYAFTKEVKGMYLKAVVLATNADGDVAEAATESEAFIVKAKATSSGGGLTGPNLSKPEVKPEEEPKEEEPKEEEPTVVDPIKSAPADKLVLAIGKTDVSVFGEVVANDVAPIIINDRTMLPARIVAESLGAEVEWIGETRTVIIKKGEVEIVITIDSNKALVNGAEVELDSAAFIDNNRTYTPIRFVAEALGAEVEWDADTMSVAITPAK